MPQLAERMLCVRGALYWQHVQGRLVAACATHGSALHQSVFTRRGVVGLLQQLLAGMRDRGATAAVVECTAASVAGGSADWVQPNIVVYTNTGEHPAELQLFGSKQVRKGGQASQAAGCAGAYNAREVLCCTLCCSVEGLVAGS